MELSRLKILNAARCARRAVVHVVDLLGGETKVVMENEVVGGKLGEAVAASFRSGTACSVQADGRTYLVNPYVPPVRIVAIGAVHISQALARMAVLAGFDIRVIDPRTAFATPERFASVDLVADWPVDALIEAPLDRYCAVVAVTHDPKIDDDALAAALKAGCFYIGALGSRRTHAKRLERLRQKGFGEVQLAKIHAPIGFDIGAASPAEIAVSILAEIIEALRRPKRVSQTERRR